MEYKTISQELEDRKVMWNLLLEKGGAQRHVGYKLVLRMYSIFQIFHIRMRSHGTIIIGFKATINRSNL